MPPYQKLGGKVNMGRCDFFLSFSYIFFWMAHPGCDGDRAKDIFPPYYNYCFVGLKSFVLLLESSEQAPLTAGCIGLVCLTD